MVTSNPAKMLKLEESLGSLQVGREADVSVLEMRRGRFELRDNSGEVVVADELIAPAFALRAGVRWEADSPLVPPAMELAA
jgi:dihydroorotase